MLTGPAVIRGGAFLCTWSASRQVLFKVSAI